MNKIVIIDYGLGNLASVNNALKKLGIPSVISDSPKDISSAKGLILPGVGAAGKGMENIQARGFEALIKDQVSKGIPLLGICLGMQLLFTSSEEGNTDCLDLIDGKVQRFATELKVPQIGWNQVSISSNSKILNGIPQNSYFYFVHSYFCKPKNTSLITGATTYDVAFCSVVEKGTVFGSQFHPEKSGDAGLQLLRNFWEVVCK